MRNFVLPILLLLATVTGSQAQQAKKNQQAPDKQISVNREYDENGNLIRFDSTYVYRWSTDSTFQFPIGKGWEDLLGKEFFQHDWSSRFFNDSSAHLPPFTGKFPFSFFDDDDFFRGFGTLPDSVFNRHFSFRQDTTFFMGPDSSFLLPPGFFLPDMRGMEDLQKLFDERFKSFAPNDFFSNPDRQQRRYINPEAQDEWEKLLNKQKKELEEFRKRWEKEQQDKIY